MQYLFFCAWLISLNIVSSRSIHVVTNGRISYLSWIVFHCAYMPHFLYLSVGGHLVLFPSLVIVSAAINMGVQVSFLTCWFHFLGYIPRSRMLDLIKVLFFAFFRNHIIFHKCLCQFTFPPTVFTCSLLSTCWIVLGICSHFW
jgi:hypothetical protein